MPIRSKYYKFYVVAISVCLALLSLWLAPRLKPLDLLHWKIYDALAKTVYDLRRPPSQIDDILLLTIDNDTLRAVPERWPYPRSYFSKLIKHLRDAGARIIAFDFMFVGKSAPDDDGALIATLENNSDIIMAGVIDEDGFLYAPTIPGMENKMHSGFVSKIQDNDGVVRRNLTYLLSDEKSQKNYLSWEARILKAAKPFDIDSLPVDGGARSFLINFRAHTADFNRLSFHKAAAGDFDQHIVEGKIVLVGLLSSMFGDIHNTPLGWMPGITLNANVFLTLYASDFLKPVPKIFGSLALICGVIICSISAAMLGRMRYTLCVSALLILLFFAISCLIMMSGYVWNYALFPVAVVLCPVLGKKICAMLFAR